MVPDDKGKLSYGHGHWLEPPRWKNKQKGRYEACLGWGKWLKLIEILPIKCNDEEGIFVLLY